MPALINNRLAAEIGALAPDVRHAPEIALAAYAVMEGAAVALGLPATGVAFYKPDSLPRHRFAFVVSWPDGPDHWARAAAAHLQDVALAPHVQIRAAAVKYPGDALAFEGRLV